MTKSVSIPVTAIANGYYGGKIRVPGEQFIVTEEQAVSDIWMTRDKPENPETRRVNTGGTDGVVGAEIPKKGQRLSAKDRIEAAQSLSGRTDITTTKEADAILAAAEGLGGSDNDDRSRDQAIDHANDAPTPDAADSDDK